jgi:dienelactone hydrolase
MHRLWLWLLLLGCATTSGPTRSPASAAYDTRFPDPGGSLGVKTGAMSERGAATLIELTYSGAAGTGPVQATLVKPSHGEGRSAGILFVHWLGEPVTTNRTEFLEEAVQLAQQGAVSLLVDALWSQADWYKRRTMDEDPAAFTAQVVSLRRGLDLLAQDTGVDSERLAVVGHDFGGMTGLLAAAADGRPRSAVLLALTPRFENWMFYLPNKHPTDEPAYRAKMRPLDPIDAVPALPGELLVQLANEDFYVPPEQIEAWKKALAGRGELRTYPTGHSMDAPAVKQDRLEWLRRRLSLARAAAR